MWPAAHSYWSRVLLETSSLPATHWSTRCPTVSRSDASSPDAATDVAAACADHREVNVPTWRGRRWPVSVSIPATRTTQRSRWRWTVG